MHDNARSTADNDSQAIIEALDAWPSGITHPALECVGAAAISTERNTAAPGLCAMVRTSGATWWKEAELSHLVSIGPPSRPRRTDSHSGAVFVEPLLATALALILFASGTTGVPKGVQLSYRAIAGNALSTRTRVDLRPNDRLCSLLPFRFFSALWHALVALLSAATYCGYERRISPGDFCRLLEDVRCSAYGGSPLEGRSLAGHCERQVREGRRPFSQLRSLMSSGGHPQDDLIHRLSKSMPEPKIVIAYGLTESAGRVCCRIVCADVDGVPEAVGTPIAGLTVSVRGDAMSPCSSGETGAVCVQGHYLFDGYVGAADLIASATTQFGFSTGDIGYLAPSGDLRLIGRSDDVFKVAGNKVRARPNAAALMETGIFADVAVLSEPHRALGHVPHVYYVLLPESSFDRSDVIKRLQEMIPRTHLPRRLTAIESVSRTGSGNVDRPVLRALAATVCRQRTGERA